MSKKLLIKNLDKIYQVRHKLGRTITKDCLTYFSKCNMKQLYEENLIEKKISNIVDNSNNIVAENVPCITFTDKFEKIFKKYSGDKKNYRSCSEIHDISLSYNVCHFAKENNLRIDDYTSESELPVIAGLSRPDGAFTVGDTIIAIEQTTENYTDDMKKAKIDYCNATNMKINFY